MKGIAILYFLCGFALAYSYVLYPLLLALLAKGKTFRHKMYTEHDELPEVYIFFSVYNGQLVLKEKLESMLASRYPKHKLHIIVGSDASTDDTDRIVEEVAQRDARVSLQRYSRRGKANVINAVHQTITEKGISADTVFILTDAYAIFEENTLFEMVKHFKDSSIGIVGANYINTNVQSGGISQQEKAYIQRENLMKYRESVVFGSMMGVYGACYAVRGVDFPMFPNTILMEDFYVTMLQLSRHKKAILTLDSRFYENIPNSIQIEFRRKKRISAGNFQNLFHFPELLSPAYGGASIAYWSHKVLRWLGPFFIIGSYVLVAVLATTGHPLFVGLAGIHALVALVPVADYFLKRVGIENKLLRFITYFLSMNVAILAGLKWYLQGIESNVWQPTNRN